jgi:ABC-type branched-subunit amino acid transport system permease subunit
MKMSKTVLALLLAVYIGVPLALGQNNYVMSLIVAALIIGGVALAWALLGNLGGMVSFGHSAFFGVGAYVSALLTMKAGVPVFAAMFVGGIGALVASLVMLPWPFLLTHTSSRFWPPNGPRSPADQPGYRAFRVCRTYWVSNSAASSAAIS